MFNIQAGDIVRVRHSIELIPLDETAPREIPAGICGQVMTVADVVDDNMFFRVEFSEPYEMFSTVAIRSDMLEVIYRFSLN